MTSTEPQITSKKKRGNRGAPGVKRKQYASRSDRCDDLLLGELRKGETLDHAAEMAGYCRYTVYKWRQADEQFAQDIEDARAVGTGALIAEARRRGVNGVAEPVFYKGEEVGSVQKYSDSLLMFLIKQRDPSFRESFNISGQVDHRHSHEHVLRSANQRALQAAAVVRGLPAPAEDTDR